MAVEAVELTPEAMGMCAWCARQSPHGKCELAQMDNDRRNRRAAGRQCSLAERDTPRGRVSDARMRISDAQGNPSRWIWFSQLDEKSDNIEL